MEADAISVWMYVNGWMFPFSVKALKVVNGLEKHYMTAVHLQFIQCVLNLRQIGPKWVRNTVQTLLVP